MYLLEIFFEQAGKKEAGKFRFRQHKGAIAKWTLLPSTPSAREFLRKMALTCAGPPFLNRISSNLTSFCPSSAASFHLEYILALHPHDYVNHKKAIRFARFPAIHALGSLAGLLKEYLSVDTGKWTKKNLI